MECPECQAKIETIKGLVCTEMAWLPFKDDNGVLHEHDRNSLLAEVTWENGHETVVKIDAPECPAKCGFGTHLGTMLHSLS